MLLLLLCHLLVTLSCPSIYTIASGSRTLYYDYNSGAYVPVLVLPTNFYSLQDPEAKWVWWTTQWTPQTIKFKDTFELAQWTADRVNTAVLKIAADDCLKVVFNGEELINTWPNVRNTAFIERDLKGKLRGSGAFNTQPNVLEMEVTSDGAWEGVMYRVEITFN